jgi:hypothetical protein
LRGKRCEESAMCDGTPRTMKRVGTRIHTDRHGSESVFIRVDPCPHFRRGM